jgi:hypothetical protein
MKRNKIILVIFISGLFIGAVVMGAFHFIDEEGPVPLESGEDEMILTEEQYQLLKDSIIPIELEQMSGIERRNAWLILNAMAEIGFVENRYPGESGIGSVTWILNLLGVGEIEELTTVRIDQEDEPLAGVLVIKIVTIEDSIYYIRYHQTWGIDMIIKESEDGEVIYDRFMHSIIDGRICEREYLRGPAICD